MGLPRLLFYCQPALGAGHLIRSLRLCKVLIRKFEIDFVYGGLKADSAIDSPYFHWIQLDTLGIRDKSNTTELVSPEGISSEEAFKRREEKLQKLQKVNYVALITEMYPFSKHAFEGEIEKLIHTVKAANPACKIICSFRGMQVPISIDIEKSTLEKLQKYDAILSHADPEMIPFEDFFAMTAAIKDKLHYTGFVSDPTPLSEMPRKKQIVVTFGAGSFGQELPKAVLAVVPLFRDYTFLFILGPKASEELQHLLAEAKQPNIQISGFMPHFSATLKESALCISLGGSTLIDAAQTNTPMLVYPGAIPEQQYRTLKFAKKKAVHVIQKSELHATRLISHIQKTLQAPYEKQAIDVNGAENTLSLLLNKILPPDHQV